MSNLVRRSIFKNGFYIDCLSKLSMMIKLECKEYGFECEYVVEEECDTKLIDKLRSHFDAEHGINYSSEFIIQMVMNKGLTRQSITKA